ncbi:GFA family protein [Sphingomonas cavernae]|uniref:CENP-V/GFA domain-containing protein n=1 Tax=Sphingomonas cavernae TaxID=2320861 RepID=A0A418W897_9SPHN|nr:hypothetical protein [Sphingomonas cavernae]RJF86214.1 hypothetical protein D3876_18945 [Sphingomonas cavernae]
MASDQVTPTASCRCGEVKLRILGAPIITAICYCKSCQEAGAGFQRLSGMSDVLDADGGTAFVLHRKDRVAFAEGDALLREHRLTPEASTRRVLARCCDTPMFLEFAGGHWLSLYRERLGPDAPPVEMRVMAGDRRASAVFEDALPTYKTHSVKFMWRLFVAWAAMGFRAPRLQPIEAA